MNGHGSDVADVVGGETTGRVQRGVDRGQEQMGRGKLAKETGDYCLDNGIILGGPAPRSQSVVKVTFYL